MQRNKLEEILQATFDAALAENLNINNSVWFPIQKSRDSMKPCDELELEQVVRIENLKQLSKKNVSILC